ncbi:hypothetical protein VNO78_09936 [Psophocarpus tetragonolobus]|uniref:C2H2-type domain-containing protein n=1 Tax=Psophocarpus tetragonolobus TaxID=3891 RepID=A0AAN9SQ29_PSOTE
MLVNNSSPSSLPTSDPFSCGRARAQNGTATPTNKRKRRPAGTPDPDAEVVSLSPKTLLESDRYVCEICNQGFQRDQNLQMHRRRHKVPWKLLKRETPVVKKRVFVCPEPTCLHHDPCHALGDLVGIKKHFRRKHSNHKQWVCERCSKGYAVQSDYKAHLKTCGTRGHSCDCGRVFSRVETFIEHQDACNLGRLGPETQAMQASACLSRTASSPSSETNLSTGGVIIPKPTVTVTAEPSPTTVHPNLELQLSTPSTPKRDKGNPLQASMERMKMKEAREQLKIAMAEKAYAEEARKQAKRQIELAELEFTNAKRIRQEALAELDKAYALKDHAIKQISSTMLQITCLACKHHFLPPTPDHNSLLVIDLHNNPSATATYGYGYVFMVEKHLCWSRRPEKSLTSIKEFMFFSATGRGVNDSRRLSRPSQASQSAQTQTNSIHDDHLNAVKQGYPIKCGVQPAFDIHSPNVEDKGRCSGGQVELVEVPVEFVSKMPRRRPIVERGAGGRKSQALKRSEKVGVVSNSEGDVIQKLRNMEERHRKEVVGSKFGIAMKLISWNIRGLGEIRGLGGGLRSERLQSWLENNNQEYYV